MQNKNNLKYFRKKNNMTQFELAKKLGVSPRYIAFLEAGERLPSLSLALKMEDILGVNLNRIFIIKEHVY